jgi:hypothetical protein
MTEPTYIQINVRLTDEQARAVKTIADARGIPQAAVIRWFVTDGIARFFMSARPTDEPIVPQTEAA